MKWYRRPDGVREARFYREIVPCMADPPVPRCYDVSDDDAPHIYILLEDVGITHYSRAVSPDALTPALLHSVVDAYQQFHLHWWEHPRISRPDFIEPRGVGVAHEATSAAAVRENQRHFVEKVLPDRLQQWGGEIAARRPLIERVIVAWRCRFAERITGGRALTLIQGDAQLGNLLLPRDTIRHRTLVIDWEGCIRGLGVWVVARMLIQLQLPAAIRQELEAVLLPRYQARLREAGVPEYSLAQCKDDYRLCVLANIPHALAWETPSYLNSALQAFSDWDCAALLD